MTIETAAVLEVEEPAVPTHLITPIEVVTKWHHQIDGIIDLVAGAMGGVANVYSGQPLDTTKVKMQTFPGKYISSLDCLRQTWRMAGIRGLYAGSVPALAANISENSVLFCAYGFCQKFVSSAVGTQGVENLTPYQNAIAGSMASIFAGIVLCPTELVKCKLQTLRELTESGLAEAQGFSVDAKKITPLTVVRDIMRENGIQGMFRGLTSTWAREVPLYFCFFGGYEMARFLLTPAGTKKKDLSLVRSAVCGGIAGIVCWLPVFPIDAVKSRVQVLEGNAGFITAGAKIIREEGFLVLYRGLAPAMLRAAPCTAALFTAYEVTKRSLNSLR